ncbi:hypothetical protein Tco_0304587 [Tanacetum coccineum]
MNDHLKAQQVMNDSMSKLREMFQTWLQQRQEQVVNLDTYTPEPSQCRKIPICYDDDDDEEIIKSSVEDLVHTPSEFDGISESECDLPVCDDSSPKKDEVLDDIISIAPGNDDYETVIDSNNDYSSSDDDSPYSEDIDYVDALPHDPKLMVGNVVQKDGEIDTDILLTIKDDILQKLLNVNLLIAKIEALKDNPTPSSGFVTKSPSTSSNFFLEETNTFDNSLPQFENFNFLDDHTKETSSGSTTTHADISLSEYDSFHLDSEPDSGDFTMDVVEDIFVLIQQE